MVFGTDSLAYTTAQGALDLAALRYTVEQGALGWATLVYKSGAEASGLVDRAGNSAKGFWFDLTFVIQVCSQSLVSPIEAWTSKLPTLHCGTGPSSINFVFLLLLFSHFLPFILIQDSFRRPLWLLFFLLNRRCQSHCWLFHGLLLKVTRRVLLPDENRLCFYYVCLLCDSSS